MIANEWICLVATGPVATRAEDIRVFSHQGEPRGSHQADLVAEYSFVFSPGGHRPSCHQANPLVCDQFVLVAERPFCWSAAKKPLGSHQGGLVANVTEVASPGGHRVEHDRRHIVLLVNLQAPRLRCRAAAHEHRDDRLAGGGPKWLGADRDGAARLARVRRAGRRGQAAGAQRERGVCARRVSVCVARASGGTVARPAANSGRAEVLLTEGSHSWRSNRTVRLSCHMLRRSAWQEDSVAGSSSRCRHRSRPSQAAAPTLAHEVWEKSGDQQLCHHFILFHDSHRETAWDVRP